MALLACVAVAFAFLEGPARAALIAGGVVVELVEAAAMIRFSRRRRPAVGAQTLVGRDAVVVAACRPDGHVRVDGEIWAARCPEGDCDVGDRVRITGVTGLTVTVVPAPDA